VIAAGGTAGHVVPALAVADALRAEGAQVSFIGGERAEAELVPAAGFSFQPIAVEGLSRSNPLRALWALARAAAAVPRSRALLSRLRPDAVMGGGGYVAGPVGLAALSLRIPLVLTEADSHLGLTNRALAPFSRRVCLAFPMASRTGARYRVTGRPSPAPAVDRGEARRRFSVPAEARCLVVFGGSLGARSINLAAIGAFAEIPTAAAAADGAPPAGSPAGERLHVIHISGRRDYPELSGRRLPAGYDLREYLDLEEFNEALAACDLVVARSGGSVFEIAAHGLPAVLIPYPHAAGNHQAENARWMSDAGAAVVIADGELTAEGLGERVAELLQDPTRLGAMAAAARGLARPRAAQDVAEELLAAAGR
jgi:UDP-N-acetylglucosamine--N-acetylmuramyl-(pentapeptide) pyrophosphoryl-undecaprenol N-acetylglucosamine transferase